MTLSAPLGRSGSTFAKLSGSCSLPMPLRSRRVAPQWYPPMAVLMPVASPGPCAASRRTAPEWSSAIFAHVSLCYSYLVPYSLLLSKGPASARVVHKTPSPPPLGPASCDPATGATSPLMKEER